MSTPASTRPTEFDWIDDAACRGEHPETFFPRGVDPALAEPARAVCRRCPVLRTCLGYALQWDVDGVWGATTKAERDELRKRHRVTAHPVFIDLPTDSHRAQVAQLSGGGLRSRRSRSDSGSANTPSATTAPSSPPSNRGVTDDHDR